MPSKVSERAVTKFLRDALTTDVVGVPQLDAMAELSRACETA
jgi:hypothetical protein